MGLANIGRSFFAGGAAPAVGLAIPILKTAISGFSKLLESLFAGNEELNSSLGSKSTGKTEKTKEVVKDEQEKEEIEDTDSDGKKVEASIDAASDVSSLYSGREKIKGSAKQQDVEDVNAEEVRAFFEQEVIQQGDGVLLNQEQIEVEQADFDTKLLHIADEPVQNNSLPAIYGVLDDLASEADTAPVNLKFDTLATPMPVRVQEVNISGSEMRQQNAENGLNLGRSLQNSIALKNRVDSKTGNNSFMTERIAQLMKMSKMNASNKISLIANEGNEDQLRINLSSSGKNVRVNLVSSDKSSAELFRSNQDILQQMVGKHGLELTNFNSSFSGGRSGNHDLGQPGPVSTLAHAGSVTGQTNNNEPRTRKLTDNFLDILA